MIIQVSEFLTMLKDSVVVHRHSHQCQDLFSYISNSILSSVYNQNELADQ